MIYGKSKKDPAYGLINLFYSLVVETVSHDWFLLDRNFVKSGARNRLKNSHLKRSTAQSPQQPLTRGAD